MKTTLATTAAPTPQAPLSQGVVANGFLFSAGFGPNDPTTNEKPEGIEAQTLQVLRNIEAVLAEAGLDFSDVVKVTAHLQNLKEDIAGYNRVYSEFLTAPYPVRTTVGSQLMDILVEIDVVAVLRA